MSMTEDWMISLNLHLFAECLVRIIQTKVGRLRVTAGLVGRSRSFDQKWWSFVDFNLAPLKMFSDEAIGFSVERQPLSALLSSSLDVLFVAEEDPLKRADAISKIQDLLAQPNSFVSVIELLRVATIHLNIFSELNPGRWGTCLSVGKLAALSLCSYLAPSGGVAVEGGTYRGGSSVLLAKMFRASGKSLHLYTFDTFSGIPSPTEPDGETIFKGGLFSKTSLEEVQANFEFHGVGGDITPVAGLVQDTVPKALGANDPVSFAFLDMDQYAGTRTLLDIIMPRMMPGGMIVIDDATTRGVDLAIRETLAAYPNYLRCKVRSGFDVLFRGDVQSVLMDWK